MNTREQEYMLALDKTRSITRAAEQLHVTQPTLSLFLTNLEKRLGTPLFHRLGKKLVPTQVGEAYLRRAQQIVALKYDFEMEMSDLTSGRTAKRKPVFDAPAHTPLSYGLSGSGCNFARRHCRKFRTCAVCW